VIPITKENTPERVLGIDPGSTSQNPTGWAIMDKGELVDYGTLNINCKGPERLEQVYKEMEKVLEDNAPIDAYCIESQYGPSGKSIKIISQIIGAIRFLLKSHDIDYIDSYTPNHIKKVVTGNGNASKDEVMESIAEIYNINKDEIDKDESDAAGIAHTALHHLEKEEAS